MIFLPRPAILNVVQKLLINDQNRRKFSGLYSFHTFTSDILVEEHDVERFIAFMIKTRANGEWIERFLSLKTPLDEIAIELVRTVQWQRILNRLYTYRNFEVFKSIKVNSVHEYLQYNNFKGSIWWKDGKIERIEIGNIDDPVIAFI